MGPLSWISIIAFSTCQWAFCLHPLICSDLEAWMGEEMRDSSSHTIDERRGKSKWQKQKYDFILTCMCMKVVWAEKAGCNTSHERHFSLSHPYSSIWRWHIWQCRRILQWQLLYPSWLAPFVLGFFSLGWE